MQLNVASFPMCDAAGSEAYFDGQGGHDLLRSVEPFRVLVKVWVLGSGLRAKIRLHMQLQVEEG